MSKQLRIWLFVPLGTLLTSTSLLAEGVITMTTSSGYGTAIFLGIKANGPVSIDGVRESARTDGQYKRYTLTSQTVTIQGNVTYLDCSRNLLTSLNLSGCTALTTLDCSSNLLTSLNLSGCTALTELICNSNKLTSLNLLGCTSLTTLYCYGNQLTSLNVSGCTALTTLDCKYNQLTSLDVSGCTALTSLDCDNNKLTSLNLSGCTALTKLDCSNNPLTSVNLSGCQSLKEFSYIYRKLTSLNVSGCTSLTGLWCSENQLTSLNLSGCTALTELNCSDNQLTSLNLSGCTALTTLSCYSNKLTSLDLSKNKALETLNCSKNLLRKLNLSGCTSIYFLTCHRNQIKAREMTILVNSLPDLGSKGTGAFRVFYDGSGEGNVCLAAHVATAQAKGWKTQFTRSYYDDDWYDYTGADNALYAVSSWSTFGGSISFTGADNLNAVPYGTELTVVATPAYGYKLTKLTANGQDILETKRFEVTENTRVEATFANNTGVETTVTQQVKLYPNPATDYVIVEGVAPASEVTLHSMTGERLYAGRADDRGTLQIDLTPYADGVYLVCVAGETYRVVVRR
ncbi:leucine-rich repeat domain-containing protein [Porphyromonas sp.]|uniref:leucine-rich repeat domain-containing protein n=1 Tax=Porphyromonas sp. TaxID=1924944 RepID=UPI003AB49805